MGLDALKVGAGFSCAALSMMLAAAARAMLSAGAAFSLMLAAIAAMAPMAALAAAEQPAPRGEARSQNLTAVGIVHGDRRSIHLSRLLDNAPVRDAVVTVLLRGVVHPTVAEADGGYTLRTRDLELPGAVSMQFQVVRGAAREDLDGSLAVAEPPKQEDKNSARQLGWWVLNFGVCIGFLLLLSRRRKNMAAKEDPP